MDFIADEQILYRSPNPAGIYCFTPALVEGFGGRLLAGVDLGGPGCTALDGPRSAEGDSPAGNQVRILVSDDRGRSWRETAARIPMLHEILFRAGRRLYALGHSAGLCISASDDNGETWSAPAMLRAGGDWHQSSTTPVLRNGRVYLVYERYIDYGGRRRWPNIELFLLSAAADADLTRAEAWRFSEPFNPVPLCEEIRSLTNLPDALNSGILETHVLPVGPGCGLLARQDPDAFLLASRLNSLEMPLAVYLKGSEAPDGTLAISRWQSLGTTAGIFAVPCPCGSLKFHILYDGPTRLYFMAANQQRHGWCDIDAPRPSSRRHLALWASPDCLSWARLGSIAFGPAENAPRNYPHLLVDGDDLLAIVRSGDLDSATHHNSNLVTLHRIQDFRALAAATMGL